MIRGESAAACEVNHATCCYGPASGALSKPGRRAFGDDLPGSAGATVGRRPMGGALDEVKGDGRALTRRIDGMEE